MAITSMNLNSNNQIFEEFNNFVETRIRLGLVFNIENISEIDYCHAKPGRVWNNEECPSIIMKNNIIKEKINGEKDVNNDNTSTNLLCTTWIVGIKMKSNKRLPSLIFISSSNHFEEFTNRIKQNIFYLKKKEKIYNY
uniref:Poly(A) polymerase RNA-binding domain-containing protein n=1 Tax=Meloidogyne enterolobii TaxID=390850 RepID=A0A6V7W758_MELEN|nr:unnamed protein product [Meloidogyne enterolobii]